MTSTTAMLGFGAAAVLAAAISFAPASRADEPRAATPDGLVAARQGGMAMSVFTLGRLGAAAGDDKPLTGVAMPAGGLARFAQSLPTLFADSTAGIEGSAALPAVWDDPAGFADRIAAYQAATSALEAAAKSDNREAFAAALANTKAACKACHDGYRAEPQ